MNSETKVRARPAAIILTPAAEARIADLMAKAPDGAIGVKLSTPRRGCSGLAYSVDYVAEEVAFDEKIVTPALVDRYVELALAPGHRAILTSGRDGPQRRIDKAVFETIRTPTLVMHGEADTVIDVSAGRGLAGAIPGAKLITYPGVGHVPMEQIPDQSAKDLRAFLATLPAT